MTRIFFAALAGAIIVFIASAVLHMATPLGSMGLDELPNQEATLQAMRDTIPNSGMYLFSDEKRGPYGLLAYTATATASMTPSQLGLEFLSVFLAALIVAFLLRKIAGTTLQRATIVALLAVFGWLSISASHWIWYKFPTAFVLGALAVEVIAWFLAGLAMAKIAR